MSKKKAAGSKKKSFWCWIKRDWRLYAMLAVPIIWYLLFCYKPMIGLIIAFQKFNIFKGIAGSKFVGLENFKFVFGMRDFGIALRNTLWLNTLDLVFGFPVPIILAILLNEMRMMKWKKFSQTLLYLPHFLSWVIIGGMVLQIFAPTTGAINAILMKLGLIDSNIPFLTNGAWWTFTYVLVGVWQGMGWGTIIYLAAITGISGELYEAAMIDGANRWQRMWNITLPGIKGTVVTLLIMNLGRVMGSNFERLDQFGNSQVKDFQYQLAIYVYEKGLAGGKFSMSTFVNLFQSVIGLILVLLSDKFAKKLGEDGLL